MGLFCPYDMGSFDGPFDTIHIITVDYPIDYPSAHTLNIFMGIIQT